VRLAALLLGVLILVGGPPTRSAGTRPIAFLSSPPTEDFPELFLISPDGTGLLPLGVHATGVDWSADGTQLVFSAPGPSQHWGAGDLFVIGAEGGTPQSLRVNGWSPQWSPTGEWIAFAAPGEGDSFELFIIRPDGTGLQPVGVVTSEFDWSPEGTWLAFIGYSIGRSRQSSSDLFLIRPDGTELTPLGVQASQFSWSPDSAQLVFTTPEENALYRIKADGTGLAPLGVNGWYPQWSPSSDLIAFVASSRSFGSLYVINSDGSGLRDLGVEASSFAWSPASDQIVFAAEEGLYLINADGTGLTPLGVAGQFVTWFAPAVRLTVTRISPSQAPNTGTLTGATIRGTNFKDGAMVHLERSGQPNVPGISVRFVSETALTADFNLTGVEVGLWDVVVTNPDGARGRLELGFRVTHAPPEIDRVDPAIGLNTGPAPVTIHGQNFLSGATASLILGQTEIVGTNTTVTGDGQSLTTTFDLTDAEAGLYDVRVVNPDGGQGQLEDGFRVNPPPRIDAVDPPGGEDTGTVTLTVTGGNFQEGVEVRLKKSGQADIVGTNTVRESAGKITTTVDLAGKTHGPWDVYVKNPDGGEDTLERGFNISGPLPVVQSISPDQGLNTGPVDVTITGEKFQDQVEAALVLGQTVIPGTKTQVSASRASPPLAKRGKGGVNTQITTTFDLTGRPAGKYDVRVTNLEDGGQGRLKAGFWVRAAPEVDQVTPNLGVNTGTLLLRVTGLNFAADSTVKLTKQGQSDIPGTGTTVNTTTGKYLTTTVDLTGAVVGLWDVVVTNGAAGAFGSGRLVEGLRVINPPPEIDRLAPGQRPSGTTLQATLSGRNFLNGATVKLERGGNEIAGTGVTVSQDGTQLQATFDLSGADVGFWKAVVTNRDTGRGELADALLVTAAPTVLSITPQRGAIGTTVSATLTGRNIQAGATVKLVASEPAASRAVTEIVGTNTRVISSREVKTDLDLTDAQVGAWHVDVVNPDEGRGRLTGGFTVTETAPPVAGITPSVGANTGPVDVTITGTGFGAGAAARLEKAGEAPIIGTGTTVASDGQGLTTTFDLTGKLVGAWDVVVQNPDSEPGILPGGFTISAPPKIFKVSPTATQNTGTVQVTIDGADFQEGAQPTLKKGDVEIVGHTVVTETQITTTFDADNYPPGQYDVIVRNPDGLSGTLPRGFALQQGHAGLWVNWTGRDVVRVGREAVYYVTYGNTGNVDARDVFLAIDLPKGYRYKLFLQNPDGTIDDIPDEEETVQEDENGNPIPVLVLLYNVEAGKEYQFRLHLIPNVEGDVDIQMRMLVFRATREVGDALTFFEASLDRLLEKMRNEGIEVSREDFLEAIQAGLQEVAADKVQGAVLDLIKEKLIKAILTKLAAKLPAKLAAKLVPIIGQLSLLWDIYDAYQTYQQIKRIMDQLEELNQLIEEYRRRKGLSVRRSFDPNEKAGPAGAGENRFVLGTEKIDYTVFFENKEEATASAQEVIVTDVLDEDLDLTTFELGDLSFSGRVIHVPEGRTTFATSVDLRPTFNTLVQIEAALNSSTRTVRWSFRGLEPGTTNLSDDGFLPPNDTSPEGEGWVTFTVQPQAGLASGTEIRNTSSIVFDVNEPLVTNETVNVVDNAPPSSNVQSLPEVTATPTFTVNWEGTDDLSGVRNYDLYVSDNNGPYTRYAVRSQDTSVTFKGRYGHTYRFQTVARDQVGNLEDPPAEPDAFTTVGQRPAAWRGLAMVGVPLQPDALNPAAIVAFPEQLWARYDPPAQGYVYFREDPNHFTWFEPREATPGKGFWAKFAVGETAIPQGAPVEGEEYAIPLVPGWNQISSPFLSRVAWDPETLRVRAAGGEAKPLAEALDLVEDYAWGWEQNAEDPYTGQYVLIADAALTRSSRSDLEPWLGYWVYAHQACELIVSPTQGGSAARATPPREAGQWTIDLQARQGEAVDTSNLLGVAPAGRTRGLQVASPPPAPGQSATGLDLHFVGSQGQSLAADWRPPTERQSVWNVIVNHAPALAGDGRRSVPPGAVTLTWPGLREVPRDVALTLVDQQTGERRYLRTVSHYTYQPTRGETARRFQIIAGPSSGALQITNLQARPTRGDGRTLQLSFALSGAATTHLDVQTLSGRVIAQPEVSQMRAAGLQSLTWTATDADGRPLPAGVYLLRVVAQDEEGQQTSAVRTVEIR